MWFQQPRNLELHMGLHMIHYAIAQLIIIFNLHSLVFFILLSFSLSVPHKHRDFHVRSIAKGKRILVDAIFFYGELHLRNGNPFDADSEREMMASPARTGDFPTRTDDHPLHQITYR